MRYRMMTLLGVLLGLTFGCERERQEPAMTPASRTTSPKERAADAIALASCDHQAACGKIGWEREYATRSQCLNSARREAANRLQSCVGEPDSDELQECLDSVAEEDCGSSTRLASPRECQAPELCLHTPNMPGGPNYNDDDIYEGTDDSD